MSHARALYDYDAQDSDELSFREGDVIEVTTRAEDWSDGYVFILRDALLSLSPLLSITHTHTHTHTRRGKHHLLLVFHLILVRLSGPRFSTTHTANRNQIFFQKK